MRVVLVVPLGGGFRGGNEGRSQTAAGASGPVRLPICAKILEGDSRSTFASQNLSHRDSNVKEMPGERTVEYNGRCSYMDRVKRSNMNET
jgi:hypothetical protein